MATVEYADYEHVVERVIKRGSSWLSKSQALGATSYLSRLSSTVVRQDNFTLFHLFKPTGKLVATGVVKRHPHDVDDPIVGHNRSMVRAVEVALFNYIEEKLLTPETKELTKSLSS